MNKPKNYQEVLKQIADLANEAQTNDYFDETPAETGQNEFIGCSIKSLPERLWGMAAATAIDINPVNAPQIANTLPDMVIEPQALTVLTAKYWGPTPRQLTVSFMENAPADLRKRIIAHMNAWAKTTCISFVETSGTGHVRIAFGPTGYWSYLGTDVLLIPQNRPTMNLQGFTMNTPEREFIRVVRHETGHTLGFPHEHMRQELVNRIDPEKAYPYFRRTQGWDRRTVDQQVLTPLNRNSIMGTPADQTSIMCYQLPGSITRDGRPITGGIDINTTDYAFAGKIYPKPNRFLSAQQSMLTAQESWSESDDVPTEEVQRNIRATLAIDALEQ